MKDGEVKVGGWGVKAFIKLHTECFPSVISLDWMEMCAAVKVCVPRVGIPFKVQGVFCSLEPEWAAAATEVKEQTKGKVKLAAVDATGNQVLASRYGVSVLGRLVSL